MVVVPGLPPTPPPPRTTTPAPVPPRSSPPPAPPLSIENRLQQMDAKLESVSLEASLHSSPYFIQHRTRSEHRLLDRKTNLLNYAVAYFQKYQNTAQTPGLTLMSNADHLITSSHPKAENNPGTSQEASPRKSDNPFHSNVYQNWNHTKKGYFMKERIGSECTRLHVCYNCRKASSASN